MKLSALLALSIAALVPTSANAATNAVTGFVTQLQTGLSPGIYIAMDQDFSQLDCVLVSGRYVTLPPSHAQFKEIYATLLAGMLMNRKVAIRIQEGSAGCSVIYMILY